MATVEFSMRDARPEDFEALWAIDQKCFEEGIAYTRRELSAYMRRRGAFTIVAENSDGGGAVSSPAGFITAESNRRGAGHIITIDVLPDFRRVGLGSKLLSEAEGRLRGFGCHSVQLEAAVNNSKAIAFYKRHRYDIVGSIPRYYPGDLNAFVLQKALSAGRAV
jgi:[ribosomal protein S18]-alanine N-acetyltransferase